ncbi:hypothetical protein [Cognatishimia sp.]|uniref:hypothetical protein n=1 Tax=Cognatishimia sp. TaxID=2211648 RepID=UPI003514661B|nr:hypothetical protein [Cognatishimia sp.]
MTNNILSLKIESFYEGYSLTIEDIDQISSIMKYISELEEHIEDLNIVIEDKEKEIINNNLNTDLYNTENYF